MFSEKTKFDQIAFVARSPNEAEELKHFLESVYNFNDKPWIKDRATTLGYVYPHAYAEKAWADLWFNYTADGLEVEVLHYIEGRNFHDVVKGPVSHLGIHVDDEDWEALNDKLYPMFRVLQRVKTIEHTNTYLIEQGRSYMYVIYDTRERIGAPTKLIKRIENRGQSGSTSIPV